MPGKQRKKLSRREREREAHRRELLEAAERVFVREGYHGATVDEIAQEAEFAVGTLYNFFKGKEDLYVHVIEKIAQNFTEQFDQQVLSIEDPEQAIASLIELRLTHFEDHRGFFRIFFEASPGSLSRQSPGPRRSSPGQLCGVVRAIHGGRDRDISSRRFAACVR